MYLRFQKVTRHLERVEYCPILFNGRIILSRLPQAFIGLSSVSRPERARSRPVLERKSKECFPEEKPEYSRLQ